MILVRVTDDDGSRLARATQGIHQPKQMPPVMQRLEDRVVSELRYKNLAQGCTLGFIEFFLGTLKKREKALPQCQMQGLPIIGVRLP